MGTGGAERYLYKLIPKLKFDSFIISLAKDNDFGKLLEKKGVKVYYLGINKINFPIIVLKFRKILQIEKPIIIDTYLIHANLFGRIFGKLFGIKKIISSVRSDYSNYKILRLLDKFTQNLVSLYIINSKSLIRYIGQKNRVPIRKIRYIPNSINLKLINNKINNNFNLRNNLGLSMDSFIIITVARLIKDKNISIVLKALKLIHQKIYYIIIGDGPERKNLEILTQKLNLEKKVFFFGKRTNIFDILKDSNLFILPSLREGMSNALLEAMALKKTCIVSNIPQNVELVREGENGFNFDPKNESELADKILKVYKNNTIKKYGDISFEIIQKNHILENNKQKYERIIENDLFFKNN